MRSVLADCPPISAPEVFQWLIQVGGSRNLVVEAQTMEVHRPLDNSGKFEELGDQAEVNRDSARLDQ